MRKVVAIISLGLTFFAMNSHVNAKVTDAIVTDKEGIYYSYNYSELADSLVEDAVLYNNFISMINNGGKLFAYKDDKVGYVNSDVVANAVVIDGKPFQEFIDNAFDEVVQIKSTIKKISVKSGKIVEDKVNISLNVDNTSLLGYTFLKINFNNEDPNKFEVKYNGTIANWSNKFNSFVIKFNGKHEKKEYSEDKVEILTKKDDISYECFDVRSIY